MDSCTGVVTVITICGGGDERDVGEGTARSSAARCSACGGMIGRGARSGIVTGSVPAGGSSRAEAYIAGGTSSADVGAGGTSSADAGIAGGSSSADAGITGGSSRADAGRELRPRGLAGRDDIFERTPRQRS